MELPEADKARLRRIVEDFEFAATHRKRYEDSWERMYRQYVLYNDFRASYGDASPPDRDAVLRDGQREWGADLKTPWAFATVETLVPRQVAHRPRMLVLPRKKLATPGVSVDDNAENMRFLIDAQQEQIGFELKLQTTIKTGQIYGLGVMKSGWRYDVCKSKRLRPPSPGAKDDDGNPITDWQPASYSDVEFDDPDVENLDIWNFFWDPYAADARAMEWAIQRTFRSTRYVLEKLATTWKHLEGLTEEELRSHGSAQHYTDAYRSRMQAEGLSGGWEPRNEDIHEVWEFHDGREVVTVLDRQWIVQMGDNPYWHGELPFYCYRPSERPGQFVGTGAIQPIEHLVAEMDTLRSQRRDNATLALNPPFLYNEGLVDPDDVIWGAGIGSPVNGDPQEVLHQVRVQDIPNSGYQEEAALKADIERATGISDPVQGVGTGAAQTATGVQLVQQAASERIKLMTRRAEAELIAPVTRHFGRMNQQKIRSNRDVRIPQAPEPGQPDRRWAWKTLSPAELLGDFVYVCEGGSTEPENVPQMRTDAQMLMTSLGQNPAIDQEKLLPRVLKLMGIDQPEAFLRPAEKISVEVLDILKQRLVGGPGEDDSPIVLRDLENPEAPPREMHPLEVDEFIEGIVQELEQREQEAQQQAQMGQQQPEQVAA